MAWEKCFGEPCRSVTYVFAGADFDNLTYVYRPPGSQQENSGTLGPESTEYRAAWFFSLFFFRLSLPPFTGIRPSCGDGCECLGPVTELRQTHTYVTPPLTPSNGGQIIITGNFDVTVTIRCGVCLPSNGTKFSSASERRQGLDGFVSQFLADAGDPAANRKGKGKKRKK